MLSIFVTNSVQVSMTLGNINIYIYISIELYIMVNLSLNRHLKKWVTILEIQFFVIYMEVANHLLKYASISLIKIIKAVPQIPCTSVTCESIMYTCIR